MAISTFWDTYLLPIVFYTITQSQLAYSCYSSLDAAIIKCFFGFSVINTFAGAVVGGAIIQQAGTIVSTGQVFDLIGKSVPAASNFFMNYVIVHALFTNVFRFIWPHDGTVLFVFFRAVGLFRE